MLDTAMRWDDAEPEPIVRLLHELALRDPQVAAAKAVVDSYAAGDVLADEHPLASTTRCSVGAGRHPGRHG